MNSKNEKSIQHKKWCLFHIIRYKLTLKIFVRKLNQFREEFRVCRRKKNLLMTEDSLFNHDRIRKLTRQIDCCSRLMAEAREDIVKFAQLLWPWLNAYDPISSFHDKASILGISHTSLRKKLDGYDKENIEKVSLHDLITIYHGEYHERKGDSKDFLPADSTNFPLFESLLILEMHMMETDSVFRQVVRKAIDKFFPGLPKYQQCTHADGTTSMVRMPPELTIVSDKPFENDPGIMSFEDDETFLN